MAGENQNLIEIVTRTSKDAKFFSQALRLAMASPIHSAAFTHSDVPGLEGLEVRECDGQISGIVFMFRSLPLV